MAAPGRKPKSSEERRFEGNPGHRPIPEVPAVKPDMGPPPDFLTGEALKEWESRAPELHRLGILTVINRQMFAIYCSMYGEWVNDVREGTQESITRANRNAQQIRMYATEFGLTPSSITRVQWKEDDEEDEFKGII